ncbi:MAG: primosomal protein N' [Lachnospiraceae bacterium]|nr:primosomal protein N' [Lachnospiraceae bacterium]
MGHNFASVIVDISHEKVDRTFQYKVKEEMRDVLRVGDLVRIPFGKGNKLITGYVVELGDEAEFEESRMKEIDQIVPDSVSIESRWIRIAALMRKNYGSTMIAALKTVLPVKSSVKPLEKKTVSLETAPDTVRALQRQFEEKRQTAKARLLGELLEVKVIPYSLVTGKLHVPATTVQGLAKKGIIRVETENIHRNPVPVFAEQAAKKQLNPQQQCIFDTFVKDYERGVRKKYLLYGVTGSGKTEVYMEMIDYILKQGKEAIVLIPEIALTYQTLKRFYERFGDVVSVMNSRLSKGERYDQMKRAQNGEVRIMIGPRSALFTPFQNLGIIIIDEEHESSYKSETMPRYHARNVAEWIAKDTNSPIVLGSATPSLESYHDVERGGTHLFRLVSRHSESRLPDVEVVDLRQELREGNRTIFSRSLADKLRQRLESGQQSMLFLNRRGYAGFICCRSCGYVMKCPHCDVSLTEHKGGKLICHYCGYETVHVKNCPQCGSKYIAGFKAGTQQIEEQLARLFPSARVLRMDGDTTKKKDDYERILSAFMNEQADILVGTQMIVKGHDFPKVTLVGILAADLSLSANDYRGAERTFQLITQAAGRAGRGNLPGEVVIQTYQPEHYAIQYAMRHDYDGFYREEIAYRRLAGYPPVSHLLAILLQSKKEDQLQTLATELAGRIRETALRERGKRLLVIGPAKAAIGKINDTYRRLIYVKNEEYDNLVEIKDAVEDYVRRNDKRFASVLTYFDFDPINGY